MEGNHYKGLWVSMLCLLGVLLAALLAVGVWLALDLLPDAGHPQSSTQATTPAATRSDIALALDQPVGQELVVWEDRVTVSGKADPRKTLLVGGEPIQVGADGGFSCQVSLGIGSNVVPVESGQERLQLTVLRKHAVQSYSPSTHTAYHPGQTMFVRLMVRKGSQICVQFQGQQIPMRQAIDQLGSGVREGFVLYTGQIKMPSDNAHPLDMGVVAYSVTCDGITEEFESSPVTCQAFVPNRASDPSATPEGYWNVGSGYIVELINGSVETFSGQDANDDSDPRNNYLPAGTVDYGSPHTIHNYQDDRSYRALRCGIRVYADAKNTPLPQRVPTVDCYYGTLPDHNDLEVAGFAVEGRHTYLTLDCLWKAPFYFDVESQQYSNPEGRKFFVEQFDARYVDITFCYASRVTGLPQIGADHPLFQRAELIQNKADVTLRLWLKKPGAFYGWHAYYNDDGQLVFRFLNPAKASKADNAYGADLTGVVIMLDVGHGGTDFGAAGRDSMGISWREESRNLNLARLVQKELETMGATVVLNRTDNEMQLTQQERIQLLNQVAPDYCLCIHHNSTHDTSYRSYEAGFFTTFSQRAAQHTVLTTQQAGIYPRSDLRFYLYYLARHTTCPVVLTENGYMSNTQELEQMLLLEANQRKAQALAQGISDYFLEINGLYP